MRFPTPRIFLLVLLGVILPAGQAHAQTILGRLLDGESMQPVPWGFIQLLDADSRPVAFTSSNESGDFLLSAPNSGQYLVVAEAFGYHAIQDGPVELGPTDTMRVEFFIPPDPERLDPLVVEAKRLDWRLRISGFYRRNERGIGQFITREDIDDIRPHDMPSLFVWGVPGMSLRPTREGNMVPVFSRGRAGTSVSGAGGCSPMYFVDGLPAILKAWEGVDFLVHPNNVAAVEVYASRAETPVQFRDSRARCGTILIWTR